VNDMVSVQHIGEREEVERDNYMHGVDDTGQL
jgi:hypothetical protein